MKKMTRKKHWNAECVVCGKTEIKDNPSDPNFVCDTCEYCPVCSEITPTMKSICKKCRVPRDKRSL